MKKDPIDELFDKPEGHFDTEAPRADHRDRFLEKLSACAGTKTRTGPPKNLWRTLSVAASLVVLLGLGWIVFRIPPPSPVDMAPETEEIQTNPELKRTQYYFSSLIREELQKIRENADTEETRTIMEDALERLALMENDYNKLEQELQRNGYSKKLLHAMITNFQTRITLLQNVMEQIEETKALKQVTQESHEENRI
ncbi:hypothetical protein [Sinomicrobium soli]|uniref:hypothetical protein n=1 Tax=Sinomicrobium sp. N-1-3-6 TaxID=2219864 RepID=UPI000DCEA726|nr:hypothetical protein [Sinomicrobium sp. N-1-3-6]RAV30081.1 hypothetical protein DN748_04580 [Sinomicrobium sp. N-1-3-6]